MLGLFVAIGFVAHSAQGTPVRAQAGDGVRLITVHDRGLESTFVTDKDTLRAAFADAKIALESRDAVEPGLDEKLVAPDYQVNVYRARPVTVVDGATRQKIVTPYQSAKRIVEDAGIQLYPEDTTSLARSSDIVAEGAGLQLTIDRATPLTVDLFGKTTELRTQGATVAEFLKEKQITLGADDRMSVAASAPITAGMSFRIWREGRQTVAVEEPIAFETEHVKDADRAVGYKEVRTPGVAGKKAVTYELEIQNGIEVKRTEITSVVLEPAVKQIEVIGAKQPTLAYTGGGSKTDWLAASAIPQDQWGYADFMVQKESGWNPNAMNTSSGACGLAQALPCSKLGPNWNNPVVALNWMNGYVNGRYGGWQGAYSFWVKNHWY